MYPAKAIAYMYDDNKTYQGYVIFHEKSGYPGLLIEYNIYNLNLGNHGFHIHDSTGKHYNPTNQKHGGLHTLDRHLGDLGNIGANEIGLASGKKLALSLSITGRFCVLGFKIVVHKYEDDLGINKEWDNESAERGNSGPPLYSGKIMRYN